MSEELQSIHEKELVQEEQQEKEKVHAVGEFQLLLNEVVELQAMCRSRPFRKIWEWVQDVKREHNINWKNEETPKEMVARQQQMKFIEQLERQVGNKVSELNQFCERFPLFRGEFTARARWFPDTGVVEIQYK